jgi:predicted transcriptional regulator
MDYKTAAQISAYLSKDYAEDFFKLLVNYQDISASEAASRLSLHIRTAQDFLEGLTTLEIVNKTEVHEKKRPYYRYNLISNKIKIEVDLTEFAKENPGEGLARLVREVKNDGANFTVARSGDSFSSITVWEGDGRDREVKNISLTTPQGCFLFHLPFPQARPLTIADIMEKAGVALEYSTEIQDIVDELVRLGVIEIV